MRVRHIALYVPDPQAAAEHYGALFGMRLLFRETTRDGEWVTLAADDASEARMIAMQRDHLVLALFAGAPSGPPQLRAISLLVETAEVDALAARLPPDARVEGHRSGIVIAFVDRYGVRWQVTSRAEFRPSARR